MQSIGVRELRQHASRYLKEVDEHRETIEVMATAAATAGLTVTSPAD